jgi:hypothetical protein
VSYSEHTPVMYRPNPSILSEQPGLIVKDCGGGVYAIVVYNYDGNGGFSMHIKENCYEHTDPRIKKFSIEFWEDGSGIFRLAPIAEALESRLAALESHTQGDASEPVKRGPGRPRKSENAFNRVEEVVEV